MADPIDLRLPENADKPLSSFQRGDLLIGVNGTDTVWIVVKPGFLTKQRVAE